MAKHEIDRRAFLATSAATTAGMLTAGTVNAGPERRLHGPHGGARKPRSEPIRHRRSPRPSIRRGCAACADRMAQDKHRHVVRHHARRHVLPARSGAELVSAKLSRELEPRARSPPCTSTTTTSSTSTATTSSWRRPPSPPISGVPGPVVSAPARGTPWSWRRPGGSTARWGCSTTAIVRGPST